MADQSNEPRYDLLIEQCRTRIRQYERMEDWLTTIQQSVFNTGTISKIRNHAREERLSAITRQVHDDLSVHGGNQNEALRPVVDILAELNVQDENVYDAVLLACDTSEPKDLETALTTVRYCQARAEQGLRAVPDILVRQQRLEAAAATRSSVLSGGRRGITIGAIVGAVLFVGACYESGVGSGINAFLVCALIGCGLGAAIGYLSKRMRSPNY